MDYKALRGEVSKGRGGDRNFPGPQPEVLCQHLGGKCQGAQRCGDKTRAAQGRGLPCPFRRCLVCAAVLWLPATLLPRTHF